MDRVAAKLGETVNQFHDLAIEMDPEDGVIWVYGVTDIEALGVYATRYQKPAPIDRHGKRLSNLTLM